MEEIEKLKKKHAHSKYFYVHMRNGAIHEIHAKGKDMSELLQDIQARGIIAFQDDGLILNTVDIVEITDTLNYIKWINQKRPKTFVFNGRVRELGKEENFMNGIIERKKLNTVDAVDAVGNENKVLKMPEKIRYEIREKLK